ncbi:MAG TPA: MmgE/PrpD family protein [Polyangiaceae bacterium]|nr:MmgE/PrpD family protein [Polyangiaceae bacterium]
MSEIDRRTVMKLLGVGAGAAAVGGAALAREVTAHPHEHGTLRHQIAEYVTGARFEDLSPAVVEKAKEQIVFFFGRALANIETLRCRKALEFARQLGRGNDRARATASVVGNRVRLAPEDAGLVNATLFGDSLPRGTLLHDSIHPGVVALPAALAMGEIGAVTGRDLILALVLGYEVLGKLGQPTASIVPSTRTAASYAATVAAGRMLALDHERLFHALGHAHILTCGTDRELECGVVTRSALLAANLAHAGAPAVELLIHAQLPERVDDLGYWEILTTLQRPYPAATHAPAALELLADLLATHELDPSSVSAIDVVLPASGSRVRDLELAARGPFGSAYRACSSVPYGLARVLVDRRIDAARLADSRLASDAQTAHLMQAIEVSFESGRSQRWARITVHTSEGRSIRRDSDFFTFELPRARWHDWLCASGREVLPSTHLFELTRVIATLEQVDDVSKLLAAATPRGTGARG